MTTTGNVILSELSSGLHNITVCARGECGKMGASETMHFTIAEAPDQNLSLLCPSRLLLQPQPPP